MRLIDFVRTKWTRKWKLSETREKKFTDTKCRIKRIEAHCSFERSEIQTELWTTANKLWLDPRLISSALHIRGQPDKG